jgi:hypothetical protein
MIVYGDGASLPCASELLPMYELSYHSYEWVDRYQYNLVPVSAGRLIVEKHPSSYRTAVVCHANNENYSVPFFVAVAS